MSKGLPILVLTFLVVACGDAAGPKPSLSGPDAVGSVDAGALDTPAPEDTEDTTDATTPACTVSADCPGDKELCLGGQCVPQTPCQTDKQCTLLGQVCDTTAGICVICLTKADCPADQECKAHTCLPPPQACATSKECPQGMVCDKTAGVCVECGKAEDCTKGYACVETVCVPQACLPGSSTCEGTTAAKVCNAAGTAWTTEPCGEGKACDGATCKPVVCTPGAKTCAGSKVATCNATGTAQVESDCPGGTCQDGACVSQVCQPGSKKCMDKQKEAECKADGSGWVEKPCPTPYDFCEGTAGCSICDPGIGCDGDKAVVDWTICGGPKQVTQDCAAIGMSCKNGQCVPKGAVCVPNEAKCSDEETLTTCKPDGSGLDKVKCGAGKACDVNACKPLVCTPSEVGCQGSVVATCNALGTGTTASTDCAATGQVCEAGACIAKPQAGFAVHGGFQSLDDVQGGGFQVREQGWLVGQSCGTGFCVRGGFRP